MASRNTTSALAFWKAVAAMVRLQEGIGWRCFAGDVAMGPSGLQGAEAQALTHWAFTG